MHGKIPPTPKPVSTRDATSHAIECDHTVSSIPAADSNTDSINTGRRPSLSASGPSSSDPTVMPTKPALISEPICPPVKPSSLLMLFAVNATASTSKPSSIFSTTAKITTSH